MKIERDAAIVRDRAAGLTWPTIAVRHNLSERHARQILADYRDTQPRFEECDVEDALREALERYESLYERLALLAEDARHEAVRLGAIKSQASVFKDWLALKQQTGLLPRDLGLFAIQFDMKVIGETMDSVLTEYNVPAAAVRALCETLRAMMPLSLQRQVGAAGGGSVSALEGVEDEEYEEWLEGQLDPGLNDLALARSGANGRVQGGRRS